MKLLLARCLVALGLLFAGAQAQALCIQGLCACTVSTTNVAFGSYNPLAFGNIDSTGSVSVKCGGVVGLLIPFKIDLSTGGGSFTARRMASGANLLGYNLYTDTSYTTIWGDGTGTTQSVVSGVTLDALGLSPAQVFWVYGRIPGRQLTVVPGPYADSISVTLTYY